MTTNRQFSLGLQALTELKTETSASPASGKPAAGAAPTLSAVLSEIGAMPTEALLLGIASDGLPVLLNLHDPLPGPMLVAADAGSGKTMFLETVAHSIAQTHDADDVKFGVITNYPEEWESIAAFPHHAGVFAVGQKSTDEFLHSLTSWAHSNKHTHQCMVLLVDDLESVASLDLRAVQDFRWLLLRGPARRVWPIVTLNAPRYGQVILWLQYFRARVFGTIANWRVGEALGGEKAAVLSQLEPRLQFCMREKENWLRFWLPSC